MKPLLLMKATNSIKTEAGVAAAITLCIVAMPIAAVFALVHGSLSGSSTLYSGPTIAGDTYTWGNCTFWAALRRIQIGKPIPNTWGNATSWAASAFAVGYLVDHTPGVGAIMQTSIGGGGAGHVAFVESVNPDSSWTISEMNVKGLDVIDSQTLPASVAARYNFIH